MNIRALVPMIFVRSVEGSCAFYRKLGFEVENLHTPEGVAEPVWAWLKSGTASLMLARASEPIDAKAQAVIFYMYAPDVPALRGDLIRSGVQPGPITRPFYAPRGEFRVVDPDGHAIMVSHT